MHQRGIAVLAAVGLFALLPALAVARPPGPSATGVRIGDHPGYVRVVVDFKGGGIKGYYVEARGTGPRQAVVTVAHAVVDTGAEGPWKGQGVRVALQPGTQMLHVTMSYAFRRFKYLSYAVVTGNRLVIDLWKSAPPPSATTTCPARLALHSVLVLPGRVAVKGAEHGIFENQFQVVLRGARGGVLARKLVHGPGDWRTSLHYTAGRSQAGTLEAVAFSAKDGAMECLAQVRVTLPAS